MSYRFRVGDEGALVLQVYEPGSGNNGYGYQDREPKWRDATVADIPVSDPFGRAPQDGQEFVQGIWPDAPVVRVR